MSHTFLSQTSNIRLFTLVIQEFLHKPSDFWQLSLKLIHLQSSSSVRELWHVQRAHRSTYYPVDTCWFHFHPIPCVLWLLGVFLFSVVCSASTCLQYCSHWAPGNFPSRHHLILGSCEVEEWWFGLFHLVGLYFSTSLLPSLLVLSGHPVKANTGRITVPTQLSGVVDMPEG